MSYKDLRDSLPGRENSQCKGLKMKPPWHVLEKWKEWGLVNKGRVNKERRNGQCQGL